MIRLGDDAAGTGVWLSDGLSPFKVHADGAYGAAGTSAFSILFVLGQETTLGTSSPHALFSVPNVFRLSFFLNAPQLLKFRPLLGDSETGLNSNLVLSGVGPSGIAATDLEDQPLVFMASFSNRTTSPFVAIGRMGMAGIESRIALGSYSLGESTNGAISGRAIHIGGDVDVANNFRAWEGVLGPMVVRNHEISAAGFQALLDTRAPGALVDADSQLHADFNGTPGCLFAAGYGLATTEGDAQIGDAVDADNFLVMSRRGNAGDWLGVDASLVVNGVGPHTLVNAFAEYPDALREDVSARTELVAMPAEAFAGEPGPLVRRLKSLPTSGPPLKVAGAGNSRNNRLAKIVDGIPQTFLFGIGQAVGMDKVTAWDWIPAHHQSEIGFAENQTHLGVSIANFTFGRFGTSQPFKSAAAPYLGDGVANGGAVDFDFRIGEAWGVDRNDEVEAHLVALKYPASMNVDIERIHALTRTGSPVVTVPLGSVTLDEPIHRFDQAVVGGDSLAAGQVDMDVVGDPGVVVGDLFVNETGQEIAVITATNYNGTRLFMTLDPPLDAAPSVGHDLTAGPWSFVNLSATCPADAVNPSRGVRAFSNGSGGSLPPIILAKGGGATNKGGLSVCHTGKGSTGFAQLLDGDPAILAWVSDQAVQFPGNLEAVLANYDPDIHWVTPATQSSDKDDAIRYLDEIAPALVGVEVVLAGDALHQEGTDTDSFGFVSDFNLDWLDTLASGRGGLALDASRDPGIGRVWVDQFLAGQRHDLSHLSSSGTKATAVAWLDELALAIQASGGGRGRGRSHGRETIALE